MISFLIIHVSVSQASTAGGEVGLLNIPAFLKAWPSWALLYFSIDSDAVVGGQSL